jgi:hypothetical protein
MQLINLREKQFFIFVKTFLKQAPNTYLANFNYLIIINMVVNGTSNNGFVDQLMLAKWFPLLRVLKCESERSLCICGLTWAWQTWCKTCQMKLIKCKWRNIYQHRSLRILLPMVPMTLQLKQVVFNLLITTPTILEIFSTCK